MLLSKSLPQDYGCEVMDVSVCLSVCLSPSVGVCEFPVFVSYLVSISVCERETLECVCGFFLVTLLSPAHWDDRWPNMVNKVNVHPAVRSASRSDELHPTLGWVRPVTGAGRPDLGRIWVPIAA